ncbi:hypothetical protein Tco_0572789 [Tanacetum coccineum]
MWMMSALEESQGVNLAWEVAKCSEPIECETWTTRMLANELDEGTHSLIRTEQEAPQPGQARRQSQEPRGLDSSLGDWNASLNEIRRSVQLLISYLRTTECSTIPLLICALSTPLHYPDTGSLSFGGDYYGAHGDSYHAGSIVLSSGYEIGGSSAGFHRDEFDPIVHSEDCVKSEDDEMRD